MAVKNTTPTSEQIAAKQSKVTTEFVAGAIAFASSVADLERSGDLNAIQADMLIDMYGSKLAKLLNGRTAGLDVHGKIISLATSDDIKQGLVEQLARIENLGSEGCAECEKHWEERMDFMRQLNKAMIIAQGEAFKRSIGKDGKVDPNAGPDLSTLKPEGNA